MPNVVVNRNHVTSENVKYNLRSSGEQLLCACSMQNTKLHYQMRNRTRSMSMTDTGKKEKIEEIRIKWWKRKIVKVISHVHHAEDTMDPDYRVRQKSTTV